MRRGPAVLVLVALLAGIAAWQLARVASPRLERARGRATSGSEVDDLPPAATAAGEDGASTIEATRATEPVDGASPPQEVSNTSSPSPKLPPLLLHVVDAERRFEMSDCDARALPPGHYNTGTTLPWLDEKHLLARGRSPLELERGGRRGFAMVVVHAPGYAPVRLSVDWSSTDERTVELERGTSLELCVHGRPAAAKGYLGLVNLERLRRQIDRWQEHALDRRELRPGSREDELLVRRLDAGRARLAGPIVPGEIEDPELLLTLRSFAMHQTRPLPPQESTTIDGLSPGTWCLLVCDEEHEAPVAAGVVECRLESRERLDLHWKEPPATTLVTAGGRLLVDPAWFADSPPPDHSMISLFWADRDAGPTTARRSIEQSAKAEAIDGASPGTYAFECKELEPGAYIATVRTWHWTTRIEVPSEGASDLVLRVPLPAEVDLLLVDAERGEPIEEAQVLYECSDGRDLGFSMGGSQVPSISAGHARFQAPVGIVNAWITPGRRFAPRSESFEVVAGRNERRLELRPASNLQVILKEGAATIGWDYTAVIFVVRDGVRRMPASIRGSSAAPGPTCTFDVTGRWFVSLGDLEGYAPVDPIPVELIAGQTAKIEIPLKREPRGGASR